jgi:hypothetical protein
MDKMTDARIRSWLRQNEPDILTTYQQYQTENLSDLSLAGDNDAPGPESFRTWLEKRHPEILEQIPLW